MIKLPTFEEIYKECEIACHDIYRITSSETHKEFFSIIEKHKLPLDQAESAHRSTFYYQLDFLSKLLPFEIEKRLIQILPPLGLNEKQRLKDLVDQFYEKARDGFFSSIKARQSARNEEQKDPPQTLIDRVDNEIYTRKATAYSQLDRAYETRERVDRTQKHYAQREQRTSIIVGLFVGTLGSLIAAGVWYLLKLCRD